MTSCKYEKSLFLENVRYACAGSRPIGVHPVAAFKQRGFMKMTKLSKDEIENYVANICVEANIYWGRCTDTVVSAVSFQHQKPQKKKNLIDSLCNNSELSNEEAHEEWQETAPDDHPNNVPYSELDFNTKVKDIVFLAHSKMLKQILEMKRSDNLKEASQYGSKLPNVNVLKK